MFGSAKIYNFFNAIFQNIKKIENVPDGTATKMYGEDSNGDLIKDDVPSGGASAFTELSDVPESYTDQAGKMLIVNENENALEFTDVPSGGLPSGTVNQTLRHNGTDWVANSFLKLLDDLIPTVVVAGDLQVKQYQASNSLYVETWYSGSAIFVIHHSNTANYIQCSRNTINNDIDFSVSTTGKILSNYLAGTGNRSLYADTSGNILADSNSAMLQKSKVTLTPAQIRALHTTPVELIDNPGVNKLVVIHSVVAYYKFIDEAYTGGSVVTIKYDSISGQIAIYDDITNIIAASSDKISLWGLGTNLANNINPSAVINKNIIVATSNAITNENANGTLTIELTYHIADLT